MSKHTLQIAHSSSYARSSSDVASGSAAWRAPKAILSLMNPFIRFMIALSNACSNYQNTSNQCVKINKFIHFKRFQIKRGTKYIHVYSKRELHPQDEMPHHEATIYTHNDQVPLIRLPCLAKNPSSG
jgi:hypothetical protein